MNDMDLQVDANDLYEAMWRADVPGIKKALETIPVDARFKYNETALMRATAIGKIDVVNVFLENNADVDAQNQWGQTAIMYAAFNGHVDVVKALIEKGADVMLKDNRQHNVFAYVDENNEPIRTELYIGLERLTREQIAHGDLKKPIKKVERVKEE